MKSIDRIWMGLYVAMATWIFAACSEDRVGQNPTDNIPPAAISVVEVEPQPGGAKISYKLPEETDISYVKCEYDFNGVQKEARSSVYKNYVTIEGLAEIKPCNFTLYLVDHSENLSEPYEGSFTPLEPPYQTIYKSISMTPDFGGVTIRWENSSKALIGAFLLAMGDEGEWEEYDLVYSSSEEGKYSIRGYNTDERLFGVVLVDQFGNTSDTLKQAAVPLYEKELDKKKFKNGYLLGDNNSVSSNRPLENIWDGNLTKIWHTDAAKPFDPPQTFTIDLGVTAKLSRMVLYNRIDYGFKQHNVRYFEVYGTNELKYPYDDEYWRSGPWRDDWVLLGDFEVVKPSGLPLGEETDEDKAAVEAGFEFIFEPGAGEFRYLRFAVKETWAKTKALHIGEVFIYGDDGVRE